MLGTTNGSKITSLPDADATGQTIEEWRVSFIDSVQQAIESVEPDKYVIFYQTDRRYNGHLISKLALVVQAAEAVGAHLVWHKTAVSDKRNTRRPNQSHLICISKQATGGIQSNDWHYQGFKATPDSIDEESLDIAVAFLDERE